MARTVQTARAATGGMFHGGGVQGGFQNLLMFEMRDFAGKFLTTGVPLMDMFIGFLILRIIFMLSESSTMYTRKIGMLVEKALSNLFPAKRTKGYIEVAIEGAVHAGRGVYTPGYKAVMHRVSQVDDGSVWQLREEYFDAPNEETLYEILQTNPIEVEEGIFVQYEEKEEQKRLPGAQNATPWKKQKIAVHSTTKEVEELKVVLKKWQQDYSTFMKDKVKNRQLIFNVRFDKDSKENISNSEFHSHRNFDNFHFEHKDLILKDIKFFLEHREWYQKRGLPYSLSILAFGEPGCGKTSFIKCLMALTGRHAVVFSVNKSTNIETVERIMRTEMIQDFPIPQNRRIYVLEEVDAMGDLVKKRSKSKSSSEVQSSAEAHRLLFGTPTFTRPPGEHGVVAVMAPPGEPITWNPAVTSKASPQASRKALDAIVSMHLKKAPPPPPSDDCGSSGTDSDSEPRKKETGRLGAIALRDAEHNLSFLLNLLDGVIEAPGRIVVMTTNHVEKLDPALIRPGRVDVRLEMRRCSRGVTKKVLSAFYGISDSDWELPADVPGGIFTPAQLTQLCRGYKKDLKAVLGALRKETQLRAADPGGACGDVTASPIRSEI